MLKINFKVGDFEAIAETSENKLVGGFSNSLSVFSGNPFAAAADGNNCSGANCTSGCGSGQNLNGCNSYAHCGTNLLGC